MTLRSDEILGQWKRRSAWLRVIAVCVLISAATGVYLIVNRTGESAVIDRLLESDPAFLDEETAVAIAVEALGRYVDDPAQWRIATTSRTVAPDGVPDLRVTRNALNPNRVTVDFLPLLDNEPTFSVHVELSERRIVARVLRGK